MGWNSSVKILKIEYKWVITGVAFFLMLMSVGTRQTFGVFFTPMQTEFATSRAPLALVMSIGVLVGAVCQPVVGKMADSLGAKRVLAVGATLVGTGLIALGSAQSLFAVYAIFGLVLAVGFSASGVIPNSAMVTRWFVEHRALALSIATAGFSMGQVVLLPVAAQLIDMGGWRFAYRTLGLSFFVVVLPVILLLARDDPEGKISTHRAVKSRGPETPHDSTPMRQAMKTASFWKLLGTFGVCGFTGGLVYTHLIPFALDAGISATAAANLLAVVGTIGLVGSIGMGTLSDRIGRKRPLAGLYFMKGLSLLVLALLGGVVAIPIVALTLGMSKGTGALTSAMTGDIYGRLSVGAIFGMFFLSHEVASATGSYLGGLTFDLTGSYGPMFLVGGGVGVLGSIIALTIREKGVQPAKLAVAGAGEA